LKHPNTKHTTSPLTDTITYTVKDASSKPAVLAGHSVAVLEQGPTQGMLVLAFEKARWPRQALCEDPRGPTGLKAPTGLKGPRPQSALRRSEIHKVRCKGGRNDFFYSFVTFYADKVFTPRISPETVMLIILYFRRSGSFQVSNDHFDTSCQP